MNNLIRNESRQRFLLQLFIQWRVKTSNFDWLRGICDQSIDAGMTLRVKESKKGKLCKTKRFHLSVHVEPDNAQRTSKHG